MTSYHHPIQMHRIQMHHPIQMHPIQMQLPNKIYFKIVYLCTQRTNTITHSKNEVRKCGEEKEGG